MARTILIDANVVEQIGRGNQQAADTLRGMRASGARIYVTQQSYNEMVTSPAIPRTGAAKREFLRDMNIQIAPPGNAAERGAVLAANNTRGGNPILGAGDVQVAAHARGINGEVWSFDRGFRNNANSVRQTLGVQVAPECGLPMSNAPEDYRVARRLAKLPEIDIDLNGNVRRLGGAGGPVRRVAPPPGRLGAGLKALGGNLAMLGLNILLNYLRDKLEERRIENMMKKLEPHIQKRLEDQAVKALEIQSSGGKAFGVVTVTLVEQETMNLASGNMMTGVVEIELTEVTTSNKAVPKDKARGEKRRTANPLGRLDYDPYTYSFELTAFPKEQVDVYRALKQELQWYEDELTKNPNLAAEDQLRLSQDKIRVERKINDWTHPPPANYAELNPPIAIKVDSLPYLKTGIENIYGWWWFNMDGGIWCYYFGRNKTVRWYDIYNHKNGQGKWAEKDGFVEVVWTTRTTERWPFEIVPSNQEGTSTTASGKTSKFRAVRVWDADIAKIKGRWKMNCDKWIWNIDIREDGGLKWSDYYNPSMNGLGTWHLTKGSNIYAMWASGSRDDWTFSNGGTEADGKTTVAGRLYPFHATKTG